MHLCGLGAPGAPYVLQRSKAVRRIGAPVAVGKLRRQRLFNAAAVRAFPGAHVDWGLAMVIYAGTTIAGALSFLPGGLGVTEGAMAMWLVHGATQLDRATALDAALLARLATLWFAVLLGMVCLAVVRRRVRARPE